MTIKEAVAQWLEQTGGKYQSKDGAGKSLTDAFSSIMRFSTPDLNIQVYADKPSCSSYKLYIGVRLAPSHPLAVIAPNTSSLDPQGIKEFWEAAAGKDTYPPRRDPRTGAPVVIGRKLAIKVIDFMPAVNRIYKEWKIYGPYNGGDALDSLWAKHGPVLSEEDDFELDDYITPLKTQLEAEAREFLASVKLLDDLITEYGKPRILELFRTASSAKILEDDHFRSLIVSTHRT